MKAAPVSLRALAKKHGLLAFWMCFVAACQDDGRASGQESALAGASGTSAAGSVTTATAAGTYSDGGSSAGATENLGRGAGEATAGASAGGAGTASMGDGGNVNGGAGGGAGGATGAAGTTGSGGVDGGPSHPVDAVENGGHWYRFTQASIGGKEAQTICKGLGGYLACIETAGEDAFIKSLAGTARPWVGLNNEAKVNTWVWINGSPTTYTHWEPGQPDNPANEHWVKILESGGWDDGSIPTSYICEWEN